MQFSNENDTACALKKLNTTGQIYIHVNLKCGVLNSIERSVMCYL